MSALHETGRAEKPVAPANTVPEKSSWRPTSPPSRACRYLWPATSMSYEHTIGRSISVEPVNARTIADVWVHRNGRSESPHWGVGPKTS